MKREHKQALTEAITDQLHPQITDLWTRLNQIMEDQVNPIWTKLDHGLTTVTAPKWAPRAHLQTMVNTLGDTTTELFHQAHQIALQTCPTKTPHPHSQHYQSRKTTRLRIKYLSLRRRLQDKTTARNQETEPHPHDVAPAAPSQTGQPPPYPEHRPPHGQPPPHPTSRPTPPERWTPKLKTQVTQLIHHRLNALDKKCQLRCPTTHQERTRTAGRCQPKSGQQNDRLDNINNPPCNGTYYIQPHKGRRRMIPYTKSYEPKSKPSRQGRIEQSSPDGAIGSARPPVKARLCRARRTIRYLVSC
jgi:hypothetical protein